MQDDIFKFTLNKPGYVVATLTSTTAGIGIDGIAKKGTNYCSPPILCNTDGSTSSSNPTISCSFYASSLGEYGYVATWGYGSGSAIVTAALYECIADNAVDANCPAAKPYCTDNVCVQCLSNDLTYGDANTNNDRSSQCPAAKPRCDTRAGSATQYTCIVPEPCNTNTDCPSGQCCTADLPATFQLIPGECVASGSKRTPGQPSYLCA